MELLFGGQAKRPLTRTRQPAFDKEARRMELLAVEYDDELPDVGELEGSGDD